LVSEIADHKCPVPEVPVQLPINNQVNDNEANRINGIQMFGLENFDIPRGNRGGQYCRNFDDDLRELTCCRNACGLIVLILDFLL
jgi:hypothetical protein